MAAALVSCTADADRQGPAPESPDGLIPVELFNEISQVAVTRVNDEGFCDGDAVGIYVVNYENGAPGQLLVEGNQGDNVRYTYDEANMKWVPGLFQGQEDPGGHLRLLSLRSARVGGGLQL